MNKTAPQSFHEIGEHLKFVQKGGKWKPSSCSPSKKVAIIIPYRDRKDNLMVLLRHLHPILKRQLLDYRIFVVEQYDIHPFNKAKLLNIGYVISKQYDTYDCIVFHDADFLLANDRNYHDCPTSPRHMSPSVEKFKYIMEYTAYMGGVVAIYSEDVEGNLYYKHIHNDERN